MNYKSILIVDENRTRLSILAKQCRRLGLHVHTATSVLIAMAKLDQGLPDLVCLDILMPSDNGLTVCEMMATDPEASKIPVIILTHRRDAETIQRCGSMCAYYVDSSGDPWPRIEPVIYELIDLDPPVIANDLA